MTRRTSIGVVLLLALSACAGPKAPVVVGLKEVSSDIVLGTGRDPAAAPVPPVGFPLPVTPIDFDRFDDFAQPSPGPSPTAAPCPKADPRDAPEDEAVNSPALPPAPGTATFRNKGTYEVSGPNAKQGRFPKESTRTVRNVVKVPAPGSTVYWFTFDIEALLGDTATTTSYTLIPEQDNAAAERAGLYISRVRTRFTDGTEEDFNPVFPGLLLLPFPATIGDTWNEAGADPQSGTAMAYTARITERARIDACGTWLDSFAVQLDGTIGPNEGDAVGVSPDAQTSFTAEYALGTQYGALSMADTVEVVRTTSNATLVQRNTATINAEPALPPTDVPICAQGCIEP